MSACSVQNPIDLDRLWIGEGIFRVGDTSISLLMNVPTSKSSIGGDVGIYLAKGSIVAEVLVWLPSLAKENGVVQVRAQ